MSSLAIQQPGPGGKEMPVGVYRPVLRWHGGKFRLARWIIGHFPQHRIYAEPFAGAASVLMQKPRVWGEYLNDLDGDLVNLFRVLQDEAQAERLIRRLHFTPFCRAEYQRACSAPGPGQVVSEVDRAWRLCVKSFQGYSSTSATGKTSGWRSKSFRSNTGPAWDWRNYPDSLSAIVDRLRGVSIESRPAIQMIKSLDSEQTLFYVDPPYPASTRKDFGAYQHEMDDGDHRALAEVLNACKGFVVVSGYRCALYDEIFPGWARAEKPSMSDHGWRTECLWLSPRTRDALEAEQQVQGVLT